MADFGKLDFAVSLNPTSAFPVDARCFFDSLALAKAAAATAEEVGSTTTKYYYGMRLLVDDGVFAKWYTIQRDRTLLEDGQENIGVSPAIIDVVALPTENIREDVFYRTTEYTFVMGSQSMNKWKCYDANQLPDEPKPVVEGDLSDLENVAVYVYCLPDDSVMGYVTEGLVAFLGVPSGWYPFSILLQGLGFEFAGVTENSHTYGNAIWLLRRRDIFVRTTDPAMLWIPVTTPAKEGDGINSIALDFAYASGRGAISHGEYCDASGIYSEANGLRCTARGYGAKAGGQFSEASGDFSFAYGDEARVTASSAVALGAGTQADSSFQLAFGKFNVSDSREKYILIAGNGYIDAHDKTQRSNAHTLDWDGNAWFQGEVYVGGTGQDDENAVRLATMEDLKNSSGNLDGKAIIDVVELPTENIREDVFYRLLTGTGVFNRLVQNNYSFYCVEALPETGLPATDMELTQINVYYVVTTDEAYGYLDETLSAALGYPVGWYPAATLMAAFEFEYGGTITNILDDPMDNKVRLLLEYVIYDYKNGNWTSHKKIGWAGTGMSAEVFNHPSNIASGIDSHAEGYDTTASGEASHAEGSNTTASGYASHAEGSNTIASGEASHAEGYNTKASGFSSHAEGELTTASGEASHAEGSNTIASGHFQHVQGRYNLEDTANKYAHIVGNGNSSGNRSNAHTIDWNGNAWYAGNIYYGGKDQDDPNARQLNFNYAAYGLPIVYLTGDVSTMSKDNKVTLNYAYGEHSGTAQVKWQGSSSLAYPKKNYSIEFDTAFEAKDGWGEHKDYCLKADWIDFSHARNIVSATLWHNLYKGQSKNIFKEAPHSGAIDGFPCMVVINGAYQGLYSFTIPKKPWLFKIDETNPNACIVGCCKDSSSTLFKSESLIDDVNFEFEYLPENADRDALIASFQRIYQAVAAYNANPSWSAVFSADTGIEKYLDTNSVIAYYVHCALTCNRDGIGKNMLFVTVDGNKWYMSPYDLDATFGLNPYGTGFYKVQYQTFATFADLHGIFNAIHKHGVDRLKSMYTNTRLYSMDEVHILDEFHNYIAQIPKACLDEEARLWPGIPGTMVNNMAQIANYYRMRIAQLDAEIEALTQS